MDAINLRSFYFEGKEFTFAHVSEVEEHLRNLKREIKTVHPSSLQIIIKDSRPYLQIKNGKIEQYGIRRSFIQKLLKWQGFPAYQLNKFGPDTSIAIFNDLVRSFKQKVRIKIEDGEALTITSIRFNDISDLEVIVEGRENQPL